MRCSQPISGAQTHLEFVEKSTIIVLYKIADRHLSPADQCCFNKKYSILSYLKNEIVLHLVFSRTSRITRLIYTVGDRRVELPKPEIFYMMPNSPVRTCVTVNPENLGLLSMLDSLGQPIFEIDLRSRGEEIKNLKNATEKSNRSINYSYLPPDLFSKPENNTSSP
jgi:hypothetical protein